jgi:sec-independent protein translocase protein TatB
MLDFGWQEFLVLTVVTVLFVGPKELPRVFRAVTGLMRKARSLAGEFHSAMDEMAREADLQDIKKEVNKVKSGTSSWTREIDPTGEVGESMRSAKSELDSVRKGVNRSGKDDGTAAEKEAEATATTTPKPALKEEAPSGKSPQKTAAKTGDGKKAVAKKAASKKASAKKSAAKTAGAKTAAAPKAAPKKAAPKKAAAKATGAKATGAKKASAKKAAAKTAAAKAPAGGGSAS